MLSIESSFIRQQAHAVFDYYLSEGARDLSHRVKSGDESAIIRVAHEVIHSSSLRKDSILIPIPSSSGRATNNLAICNIISDEIGCRVIDCLSGRSRESLYDLKKKGILPSDDFFDYKLNSPVDSKEITLFDAVIDTGNTLACARKAFDQSVNVNFLCHSMRGYWEERSIKNRLHFEQNKDFECSY